MGAGGALIRTKLFVPPIRSGWLSRPRLLEMLGETGALPLTLISAGAGFGKTGLASEWVERSGTPTAWLSLDSSDDDPLRFWKYLFGALATVFPELVSDLALALQSDDPPEIDGVLAKLINRLSDGATPVAVVLDDLHAIEHDDIHASLCRLVRHCPPQLRLIVITREDPPWPLSRLRARGQMREIRARDLRFSLDEAVLLLETTMGRRLELSDCQALLSRTEGWVVGLHMAAMSLRASDDAHAFVTAFSGSHRFVLDYLAEEVLAIQDEDIRRFLIETSVFDRFCAELCDAAMNIDRSRAILDELETRNLFIVPLDDTREWYRYHHLFADYLRVRAKSEAVELGTLHERASAWFEAEGLVEEAIEHALRGASFERAATLLEAFSEQRFTVRNQLRTIQWLAELPPGILAARAALSAQRIWSEFVVGNVHQARNLLDQARAALANVTPESKRDEVRTQYDVFESWIAFKDGQPERCIEAAGRVLERLGHDHSKPAELARLALAAGHLHRGELELARSWAHQVLAPDAVTPDPVAIQVACETLAHADLLDGDLASVEAHYRLAIAVVGDDRGPVNLAAGMLRLSHGEALRERGELAAAQALLLEGIEQCERQTGMPERVFAGELSLARALLADGKREEALSWLERAEARRERRMLAYPSFDRVAWRGLLYRARLWLELEMPERVNAWLASEPPVPAAGDGGTFDVLRARVALMSGDARAALAHLGQETRSGDYASVAKEREQLRAEVSGAFGANGKSRAKTATELEQVAREHRVLPGCDAEELNERERAILRLMEAGLSNSEIASELHLSVHTVKWHARNLYGKLDVTSRTRAIARAKGLGLLK